MRAALLALSLPLLLVAGASPALASTPFSVVQHDHFPQDLAKQTCDDSSTQGEEVCLAKKLQKVDHSIDLVATQLRKVSFDTPAKARVDKAQKAWFAFRDADCQSLSDLFEGGTEAGVIYQGCQLDDSNARLKRLKAQLKERQSDGG